eukprot:Nk52_evm24s913 gene=Nk52_evmTU24s913
MSEENSYHKQQQFKPRGGGAGNGPRRGPFKGKKNGRSQLSGKGKSTKQKIRDIERLLRKPDLLATVRQEKERILELLKGKIEHKVVAEKEKKYASKYRMVRFFERRKLLRKILALEKKTAKEGEKVEYVKELEVVQGDMNYVKYFPKDRKYVSLFPKETSSTTTEQIRSTKEYKSIQLAVKEGTLSKASLVDTSGKPAKGGKRGGSGSEEDGEFDENDVENDPFFMEDDEGDQ